MPLPARFVAHVSLLLTFTAVARAQSVTVAGGGQPLAVETGQIRGTAFDSLAMRPVSRAVVELMGTGRMALSDERGRFHFDGVAVGQHEVAFHTPAFDSLGLGILGGTVSVLAGKTASVGLSTPSLRTLWGYRCSADNRIGNDSGIVWGTIHDAANDSVPHAAAAAFSWYSLRPGTRPGVFVDEVQREARTGSDGVYFACGVPTDIVISSRAVDPMAASGPIDFTIGAARVMRLDFLVSTDLVVPESLAMSTSSDSAQARRATGSATVRGTVVDQRKRPLVNALVNIATTDSTVRTDENGRFQLSGLPAGTHSLYVRRVGLAPSTQTVHLRPDQASDVTISMGATNTLATVNVRAERVKSADRLAFEQRQKRGFSYTVQGDRLTRSADLYNALVDVPRLRLDRQGFGLAVSMKGAGRGECTPNAFLDGFPLDVETASSLPSTMYRAVEVYANPYTIPAEFVSGPVNCGVMLFWTTRKSW